MSGFDQKNGEDMQFLDVSAVEVDLPESTHSMMCGLYRKLASGGEWQVLLKVLKREALRCLDMESIQGCAALIWAGPEEFYQEVVWGGDQEESAGALACLLARDPSLQSALKTGQIVVRHLDDARVDLLIPISDAQFLGAFYIIGVPGPELKPLACAELIKLFGLPGVQLIRQHRMRQTLRSCQEENRYFRERERRHYLFKDLVCESELMRQVYDELHERTEDEEPLWMTGEGGTGKELLARALHHLGSRQEGMLIRLGCADFPAELVDFELFGCVASELTGAVAARKGIFELAEGGTIFLDEIDRLSPMIQGKLVRVLKEKEVRRIGDVMGRPVDARFIASSHRDLESLCEKGQFRRDLSELLRPHRMHVPPLRERQADILPLARIFLKKFASRYDGRCREINEELASWLTSYRWPGNVRQLQTFLEAAVLMAKDREVIELQDLILEPS